MQRTKHNHLLEGFIKREKSLEEKIARFAGDITFVYVHVAIFILWIITNILLEKPFDSYPFILLTLVVSLEAIFLSTFVLIVQNKDAERSERRTRLDLEIDKRAAQEIDEIKISLEEIKTLLASKKKI